MNKKEFDKMLSEISDIYHRYDIKGDGILLIVNNDNSNEVYIGRELNVNLTRLLDYLILHNYFI